MRLIDADAMREDWLENGQNEYVYDTNAVLDSIDNQPTVDAEPVRNGHWIKENIRAKSYLRLCSACGKIAYFCGTGCSYKYCPNCGAKMVDSIT